MNSKRVITALLSTLAVALALPALASAATRYASPTGSGAADTCAAANPCSLTDALASAQVGFDMFKLAASVEATHNVTGNPVTLGATKPGGDGHNGLGFGLSGSLQVSDGVSLNLGGRYFDTDTATADTEGYQIAASLVAAVTETLTLTGEIGVYGQNSAGMGVTAGAPLAPGFSW